MTKQKQPLLKRFLLEEMEKQTNELLAASKVVPQVPVKEARVWYTDEKVFCPHCQIGYTIVPVKHIGDSHIEITGLKEHRKCPACTKPFVLGTRTQLIGRKIEG